MWQTDPAGEIASEQTAVVFFGGNYESFAADAREGRDPTFYTTEDASDGPLVRFTPDAAALACYNAPTKAEKWCTLNSGTLDYLRLEGGCTSSGTFTWGDYDDANPNEYPSSEGIDTKGKIIWYPDS